MLIATTVRNFVIVYSTYCANTSTKTSRRNVIQRRPTF